MIRLTPEQMATLATLLATLASISIEGAERYLYANMRGTK